MLNKNKLQYSYCYSVIDAGGYKDYLVSDKPNKQGTISKPFLKIWKSKPVSVGYDDWAGRFRVKPSSDFSQYPGCKKSGAFLRNKWHRIYRLD